MVNHQQHQAPEEERFRGMSASPFRVVTINSGRAPYPSDHNDAITVDLISGEAWQCGASIRQPVAEDFLQPHRPLHALPVVQFGSDQDIPVIEPGPYVEEPAVDEQNVSSLETPSPRLSRRDTVTSTKPPSVIHKHDPVHKRPKSALDMVSHVSPSLVLAPGFDKRHDTSVRVPTIGSDMFSSALGGLQRLPDAPDRKQSRCDRFKRFFSSRRRREYGRTSTRQADMCDLGNVD
jgi:hypothetical protein